tara:strand:+ start:1498 stop:1677 length:180 start_codon:yes stop_codon:yes gene_type:complete
MAKIVRVEYTKIIQFEVEGDTDQEVEDYIREMEVEELDNEEVIDHEIEDIQILKGEEED